MRAIKRVVSTSFWDDKLVADEFTPEDKYFYLFLLTNPHTTQLGIYELPISKASYELGYSKEAVRALIDRFQTKYHLIRYSSETGEIAIKHYLRHSIIKGGKPVEDCLMKELKEVKDISLINFVYRNIVNKSDLNETVIKLLGYIRDVYINTNDFNNDNDNENERYVDVSYHESSKDDCEPTPKKKRSGNFVPPSYEEVAAYCKERNNSVDANRFVDFYASKGWMVGKTKMKDWKAAVRNWEGREKNNYGAGNSNNRGSNDNSLRDAEADARYAEQSDLMRKLAYGEITAEEFTSYEIKF